MSLLKNKNRIELFDYLVQHQMTGTQHELAQKLKMSKRQLYNFLEELKEMKVPIEYCKKQQHYYYKKKGSLIFDFVEGKPLSKNELHKIRGGYQIKTSLFLK
jgi:predicted DNA-binding transcriptional regulator YafY